MPQPAEGVSAPAHPDVLEENAMASSRSLSLIDTTFLTIENNDTPMHVASLMIISPPPGGARRVSRTLSSRDSATGTAWLNRSTSSWPPDRCAVSYPH